ncbi:MAG: peptidase U34 [Coriobacteriia bacterium]|nr:peptidase U34 [Coriobacteriia bacterium]
MCDTMCIMSGFSSDGLGYFAKNSDRSPNEPLLALRVPAMRHAPGTTLKCTYIDIPQVEQTREIIICKPSWMWGAEMGVNDARVAIGNEAVFTKAKRGKPSLIGMDLLRLALERTGTALEAAKLIVDLLLQYGQGGNCGFDKEFHYDNSFLISDPTRSFVLETSAKNYALAEVKDAYAISNRLCIGTNHIAQAGIAPGEDFARSYTEPIRSYFAESKQRRHQAECGLQPTAGARGLIEILRTHEEGLDGKEFSRKSTGSVCMHAGGMIGDHTTGSIVLTLRERKPITLWLTGSSTPCISAFKPVFWSSSTPPLFDDAMQSLDYWLRREHLHRAVIAGKIDVAALRKRIRTLEQQWFAQEEQIMSSDNPSPDDLAALSASANRDEQSLIDEFYDKDWQMLSGKNRYTRYWRAKNERLGLERA